MKLVAGALYASYLSLVFSLNALALDTNAAIVSPNLAGTVRVNNLACLEALVNILTNGVEVIGITITVLMLIGVMTKAPPAGGRRRLIVLALIPAVIGLAAPGAVNLLFTHVRDANLFI